MNNNDKLSEFDVCCCPTQHVTEEREHTADDAERENYLRTIAYDLTKITTTAKEVLDVDSFTMISFSRMIAFGVGWDMFIFDVNEDGTVGDVKITSLENQDEKLRKLKELADSGGRK